MIGTSSLAAEIGPCFRSSAWPTPRDGPWCSGTQAWSGSTNRLVGFAEPPDQILKQTGDDKPIRTDLDASLRLYQEKQLARDRALRRAIRTREELRAYQGKVRENFQQIVGPWPERTPLKPIQTGSLLRDGYTVQKILIQSQPGFYVPINLYLPSGRTGRLPAVLAPEGHAPLGKAHHTDDCYQARFITLARKGYVVCAYDPWGQGEREPYGAKTGNHHMIQGYQCMPSGRHSLMYFLWDGIRCLDYLQTRPEVDPQKIACSGCSGGGALTHYLSAIDERIALSAPSSWIVDSPTLIEDNGLHVESWFPDMCAPYGPGTDQLLACIAPRPLLIIGNQFDGEFPPEKTTIAYDQIKRLYESLGLADRVEYVNVPTRHGYWPEARREFYRFLNKWFDCTQAGIEESPPRLEMVEDLNCAPGGHVRNLPGAETVYSLNRKWMEKLAVERLQRRSQPAKEHAALVRRGVLASTRYQPPDARPTARFADQVPVAGGTKRPLALEWETDFWCNADLHTPKPPLSSMTAALIGDDNDVAAELAGRLRDRGIAVLHLQTDRTQDRKAVMGGKPDCGRWTKMLVQGAALVKGRDPSGTVQVVACGIGPGAALSAQFAGIVSPESFAAVAALDGLDRLESLAEEIAESSSLQMLPGALRWYDETDLLAALAPLPTFVGAVRDKHGKWISRERLLELYRWSASQRETEGSRATLTLCAGESASDDLPAWIVGL